MSRKFGLALVLLALVPLVRGEKSHPDWKTGKIISADRARYLAGIYHDSQSNTTESGNVDATVNGNSVSGGYSGHSDTSTSGIDMPLYKVYDNLVIEGDDAVYVTQERLRWRWSKGAHVAVNSDIQYYVSGRKLHVLDEDGKEHAIEIVKEIRKDNQPAPAAAAATATPAAAVPAGSELEILSTPEGADIFVDGDFVGSTPSTITSASGSHKLKIAKKGFNTWEREVKVASPHVRISADLEAAGSTNK